jgi:DNA-binding response OmpR family regulator
MKNILTTLRNLNILYAEDDKTTRINTVKTLELLFNRVYSAKNGTEALELFDNDTIHIVLLDYKMPGKDGFEVAKAIRDIDAKTPIIIASAYSEKENELKTAGVNLIKYIEKPLQYDSLTVALEDSITSLQDNHKLLISLGQGCFYDYAQKQFFKDSTPVKLSNYEIKFLETLLKQRGRIVNKDEVFNKVFGYESRTNTLRNMVYRLRKKIGKDIIHTIKDIGYLVH